jgi:hypothetical protein
LVLAGLTLAVGSTARGVTAIADHPRLAALNEDIAVTRQLIADDPLARRWYLRIHESAERFTQEPLLEYSESEPRRVSRRALLRITTLGAVYRISGEQRYALRAIEELVNVCQFRDWGDQATFLATAEMTAAVGFGYDWTYGVMSPSEREVVRQGLIRHGLRPGLEEYSKGRGWPEAQHNWNHVCNGGLIVGALAIVSEEPRVAQQVLSKARQSLQNGMSGFAPDGAWEEGPTYWNYATRYLGFAIASLQTALGNDWGLSRAPGLANTGLFRIHTNGPTNQPFNFADSEDDVGNSAQMHWFARSMNRPEFAAFEADFSRNDPNVFDLLWYRPVGDGLLDRLPRSAVFRGVDLVCMRGAWNDPMTTYVAMKGGSNQAHHGHLNLGTFVLDALGQRWVVALGGDNYDLPGYFSEDRRWDYYRCGTAGQNVLMFDEHNQDPSARTRIRSHRFGAGRSDAVIDLSEAYRPHARWAMRGIALLQGRDVLVQDEFQLSRDGDVRWGVHTTADVELRGRTALLRQSGQTMAVRVLGPPNAQFEVRHVRLDEPQKPSPPGLNKLVVRLEDSRRQTGVAVLFSPGEGRVDVPPFVPLNQWGRRSLTSEVSADR